MSPISANRIDPSHNRGELGLCNAMTSGIIGTKAAGTDRDLGDLRGRKRGIGCSEAGAMFLVGRE